MTRRRMFLTALTLALGLTLGAGLRRSHDAPRDRAHVFLALFEARCLPMLQGRPADLRGLTGAPATLHDTDNVDRDSGFSVRADARWCLVSDQFAPLDAAEGARLAELLRARIPELTGLAQSDDIVRLGDVSLGWMQGTPGSPGRHGIHAVQFGTPPVFLLSLALPPAP